MVTPIAGNQADIGIAIQAEAGTPAAAAQHRFYLTGGGFAPSKGQAMVEETTEQRIRSQAYVTTIRGEGSPQAAVRQDFIGALLLAGMGQVVTTGVGDPYTHTFGLNAPLPYLTLWRRLGPMSGGLYERFTDCKVTQLALASQAAGLLQVTATISGLVPDWQDEPEDSVEVETGPVFLHADGQGALTVEGEPISTIESVEVSIDNGGGPLQGDAVTPYAVNEGLQVIRIVTTELVEDFELWNRMIYGSATPTPGDTPTRDVLELDASPAAIDFTWTRPGSPTRSLQLTAERVMVGMDPIEANVNGDPLKRRVAYEVLQPASGSALVAVLINGVESYGPAGS